MNYKATAIYFSPTSGSAQSAISIAKTLDKDASTIDVTIHDTPVSKNSFNKDELAIFCAPVYGGRMFGGALERLKDFKGDSTPCVVTVTYGNRHYDDALIEFSDFLSKRGFVPIAGAALVARHTFGEIQVDRPNEEDFTANRDFANKVNDILKNGSFSMLFLPGNHPYIHGDQGGKGGTKHRPTTNDSCIMCGLCTQQCPQGAISDDNKTIDIVNCISCFRCIRNCPVQAKECITEEYLAFAKEFTAKLCQKRENEYFL